MHLKQVVVILGATVLAGLGVWGNLLLRQEFQIRQVIRLITDYVLVGA